jgi:hypothetical protein
MTAIAAPIKLAFFISELSFECLGIEPRPSAALLLKGI